MRGMLTKERDAFGLYVHPVIAAPARRSDAAARRSDAAARRSDAAATEA